MLKIHHIRVGSVNKDNAAFYTEGDLNVIKIYEIHKIRKNKIELNIDICYLKKKKERKNLQVNLLGRPDIISYTASIADLERDENFPPVFLFWKLFESVERSKQVQA